MNAQEPYAIHLSKANGLPSNTVYNVFQDSKGFIWFTSATGLCRYDGFEFKTYQCEEQTSSSGSSIKEDIFGRIWYENFDGYLYYVKNDTLKALKQNKPIGYLPIGMTKKHLFVMQEHGIDVFELSTLIKIKTIKISTINIQHSISNKNHFYYLNQNSLYAIDDNLTITISEYLPNKSELTKQVYCTDNAVYIVGKHNEQKKCYVFDTKLKYIKTISINEPDFIQGGDLTENQFWIHSPKGTFVYDNNKVGYKLYFHNKSISSVIKDRQDNYWFCTANEGVYLVPDINNTVFQLPGYLPNKIVETKEAFFVGTRKGELIKSDKSFSISSVVNKKTDNSEIYYLAYDSISNNMFYSSKLFTYIPQLNYQSSKNYDLALKEITKIDQTYYAIASSGFCGLIRFEKSIIKQSSAWDITFAQHQKQGTLPNAHLVDNVRGKSLTFNTKSNTIYFATNIGLYKCTPTTNSEIKFNNKSVYASKLTSHGENIYALTSKGNLLKISKEQQFTELNKTLGIKDFDIKLIKQFDEKLIIITPKSVLQLNLQNEQLKNIDVNINAIEINDVLLKGDSLYLITNSGIIKTNSQNKALKKKDAILQVNEFIVNDKLYDPNVISHFNYNQNAIIINFSLLDFGTSTPNQLFYKINEDTWQPLFNETRTIQFASLAPGNYHISFKLNDSVLLTTLTFNIDNPFWKTWWYLSFCTLMFILVGYVYYKWQLNKLRVKNRLLEDKNTLLQEKIELEYNLNKSVLTSIKSQMNPHFFYNALNTIQAYIFTNDKIKANNYLAKFSKLTRLILEQSEKETISVGEESASLTLYLELEKMRFSEGFEYAIEINTKTHKDNIDIPPMLIQPYIENAVKHGLLHKEFDKKLTVLFEEKDNHLIVTIDDNGIGRKRSLELNKIKNEKYQSFSTQANEKRLEILNRNSDKIALKIIDKKDQNDVSTGTKVILTIPII